MGTVTILGTTTKNPITLIGERAGVCWGADITDEVKNYNRGLDCLEAGHWRTLEFVNVEMVLDGYSARVIREWYTHIGCLPTRLQASTRYINYKNFDYIVPASIAQNNEAYARYVSTMDTIMRTADTLEKMGMPREDVANLLPLGMTTKIVDKRNLRNLIDMSRQRMCARAYWEFRELFRDVSIALTNYAPDEWGKIVNKYFMPKCDALGYCPEKKSCGRHEQK